MSAPIELLLWLALLPLLVASGFWSGSETVVFGLTGADRDWLRRQHPVVSDQVDRLLAEPRGVLVTILVGNNIVNTVYFVISSSLAMRIQGGAWVEVMAAVVSLLLLVIVGETLPKLASNLGRRRLVCVLAGPLLLMHRILGPVRRLLDGVVVAPLVRLAGPPRHGRVDLHELGELLTLSQRRGILAGEESAAIRRVTLLGRRRVREVMTPRVFVEWVRRDATHAEIEAEARRCRRRRLLVADPDLDHVVGWLDVRSFLLDARGTRTPMSEHLVPASFVPELAAIDQLLDWFQRSGQRLAVVVDEFGGTAGLVTLRDAIGEIGGHEAEAPHEGWVEMADGAWIGPGDADLAEAFGRFGAAEPESISDTVAGAIMERLGRVAAEGDEVDLSGWTLGVLRMDGTRIDRVRWRRGGQT
ncbi:MAG: Magnesium and cobalt efflux protein CorC [Planctomycetota bacterium]|jgi:putative hemolysin